MSFSGQGRLLHKSKGTFNSRSSTEETSDRPIGTEERMVKNNTSSDSIASCGGSPRFSIEKQSEGALFLYVFQAYLKAIIDRSYQQRMPGESCHRLYCWLLRNTLMPTAKAITIPKMRRKAVAFADGEPSLPFTAVTLVVSVRVRPNNSPSMRP